MYRILVADDEKLIRAAIHEYAEFLGYCVTEAVNGMEAVQLCREQEFDVIIMDIMMPVLDGFTAFKMIKEIRDIPVLMLSAKGEEYDKLYGFDLGIEDYVVKPFSMKELMARVNVIIQRRLRIRNSARTEQILKEGCLSISPAAREVRVEGALLDLRPKEFDLLLFLVKNRNIVFSRETLLEKVWGYDYDGDDRTVDSQIKLLRQALGTHRSCIVTVRGVGYKFTAEEKQV